MPRATSPALYVYGTILVLVILAALIISPPQWHKPPSSKTPDSSSLRQIGQSALIHAMDHKDRLPSAATIWEYAGQLAQTGGFESAAYWHSRSDILQTDRTDTNFSVLLPALPDEPRQINPAFLRLKPFVAVAVGDKMTVALPATTPLAWTRGLRPDGTWAPHSPYGGEGGHIVFLGGNVAYFPNLTDDGGQLLRPDGTRTANILEALPPGTRILEYVPTPAEQSAAARR